MSVTFQLTNPLPSMEVFAEMPSREDESGTKVLSMKSSRRGERDLEAPVSITIGRWFKFGCTIKDDSPSGTVQFE